MKGKIIALLLTALMLIGADCGSSLTCTSVPADGGYDWETRDEYGTVVSSGWQKTDPCN